MFVSERLNHTYTPRYQFLLDVSSCTLRTIVGVTNTDILTVVRFAVTIAEVPVVNELRVRSSHRMVTIAPFILLGFLGVTFYFGSRLATPRVQTLDDLSSRTNHGGTLGRRVSSTNAEPSSARTRSDGPHTKSGDTSAHTQALREAGTTDDHDKSHDQRSSMASGVESSWILHTREVETGKPWVRAKPPVTSSERSIRSVWKAGPGHKTNPEQVNSRSWVDCVEGENGASFSARAYPRCSPYVCHTPPSC